MMAMISFMSLSLGLPCAVTATAAARPCEGTIQESCRDGIQLSWPAACRPSAPYWPERAGKTWDGRTNHRVEPGGDGPPTMTKCSHLPKKQPEKAAPRHSREWRGASVGAVGQTE
jgi:hypothetical protein